MSYKSKRKKLEIWQIVLIVIGGLFLLGVIFGGRNSENANNTTLTNQYISLEEAKNTALEIPYNNLFRYNEQYEGKLMHYSGEIVQIIDNGEGYYDDMRVATKSSYEDIIYVLFDEEQRFLEGDYIDIYGISSELITYETIMGGEVTIPKIIAKYVVMKEKEIPEVSTLGSIYVSAENFDSDADIDGLEFTVSPKDTKGDLVETEGMINVKLYRLECTEELYDYCLEEECTKKNNDLLEEWNILIDKEKYDYSGFDVQAEYNQYKVKKDDRGCVEITLTTPDGKSFEVLDDSVYPGGY